MAHFKIFSLNILCLASFFNYVFKMIKLYFFINSYKLSIFYYTTSKIQYFRNIWFPIVINMKDAFNHISALFYILMIPFIHES